uniref:Uncharacterized protein n=1 Tax=Arundo donax TaxID=35708 RepID=A0A0A9DYQ4_ARUDO
MNLLHSVWLGMQHFCISLSFQFGPLCVLMSQSLHLYLNAVFVLHFLSFACHLCYPALIII